MNVGLPLEMMSREGLMHEVQQLRQLVVDADAVTRARFEYYGLCDSIDNAGRPYPSQWAADLVKRAKQSVQVDPRLQRYRG